MPIRINPKWPRIPPTTRTETENPTAGRGRGTTRLGKYVWPGYLSQDVLSADLEVFWAMDDRFNMEFPYYPFPSDSTRRGIGLQVDGRAFQWSNALAENTIFFVYTITNISDKDLDSVFFGDLRRSRSRRRIAGKYRRQRLLHPSV